MPIVPTNAPVVQPAAVRQPTFSNMATASTFGSDIARQTQATGRVQTAAGVAALDRILAQKKVDDERELKNALNRLSKLEKDIWNGDGTDVDPGFGNLAGQDALDGLASARLRLISGGNEIQRDLSSNRQRQIFKAMAAEGFMSTAARFDNHTAKQRKVANAVAAKTRWKEAVDSAALDYNDERRMAKNFAVTLAEATTEARELGYTKDEAKSYAETAVSAVAVAAIEAAIAAGDMVQAKALFERYSHIEKDDAGNVFDRRLDGVDITELRKKLKAGTVRFASQEIADAIIAQGAAEGWTPAQHLAAARKVREKDPEIRDAVLDRITKFAAEQARALALKKAEDYTQAGELVENGMAVADLPMLSDLDISQRTLLREAERRTASQVPVHSDPGLMRHLTRLSATELLEYELPMLKLLLDPHDFKIIESIFKTELNRKRAPPTADNKFANPFTVIRKFETRIDATFKDDALSNQQEKRLRQYYEELVQAKQQDLQRAITNDEMDVILDSMFDLVTLEGSFWSGPGPRFDDTKALALVEVEEDLAPDLIQRFREANAGRVPTALELKQMYVDYLARVNK